MWQHLNLWLEERELGRLTASPSRVHAELFDGHDSEHVARGLRRLVRVEAGDVEFAVRARPLEVEESPTRRVANDLIGVAVLQREARATSTDAKPCAEATT